MKINYEGNPVLLNKTELICGEMLAVIWFIFQWKITLEKTDNTKLQAFKNRHATNVGDIPQKQCKQKHNRLQADDKYSSINVMLTLWLLSVAFGLTISQTLTNLCEKSKRFLNIVQAEICIAQHF